MDSLERFMLESLSKDLKHLEDIVFDELLHRHTNSKTQDQTEDHSDPKPPPT